jgi:iron-sulfur cluster repair protein YtfE (RIC family)
MTDQELQLGCNTDDMKMIHGVFRREFRLAPPMVRGVEVGDAAKAGRVTAHLTEIVEMLHHHHHGEEVLVFDKLETRAPACALHVGLMRQQHQQVQALLDQVAGLSTAWTADPSAGHRESLAVLLDEISATLNAHLGQEEDEILPVAETSMTEQEWMAVGEAGMAALPKNRLLVQLGYILEDQTPAERKEFMTRVPPPARLLYKLVGRRKYEKEIAGTRAPA